MKTIFNYINTLAENSQSPLNFLTSYHLAAIHYFVCHSSVYSTLLGNDSQILLADNQVCQHYFFLGCSQVPLSPWRASQPSCEVPVPLLHLYPTATACVYSGGLHRLIPTPPSYVRASSRKRRGRIILACCLANRSG